MKILNHSPESEAALIGSLTRDSSTIADVRSIVKPDDFYNKFNRVIFEAIISIVDDQTSPDIASLQAYLKGNGLINDAGDEVYVYQVANSAGVAANNHSYAETIAKHSASRKAAEILSQHLSNLTQGKTDALRQILKDLPTLENLCHNTRGKSKMTIITVDEFLTTELPEREIILGPWLPKQGLAMIYALPGIGKTHLGLNIAYSIATGSSFLSWSSAKPWSVLYLDGEMAAKDLQSRLSAISRNYNDGKPISNIKVMTPDFQTHGLLDLSIPEGQAELNPHLDDVDVIIVDNISTLCRTGKENEAESWLPVQQWALKMKAAGRSVVFIHHASKGNTARGTSKRGDVLDSIIQLTRPDDYTPEDGAKFEVKFEKSRGFFGADAATMIVQLTTSPDGSQSWSYETLGDSCMAKIIELQKQGGKTQTDIANELGISKSKVSRKLSSAREQGMLT